MSMVMCERCDRMIDSDCDAECFVYVGNYKRLHAEMVLCERCREERELEQEALDAAAERAMALT